MSNKSGFRSWERQKAAMRNFSAAKSTGLCLSAFIDGCCFEGMLELHRDGTPSRELDQFFLGEAE
jgi:hypothetical protein